MDDVTNAATGMTDASTGSGTADEGITSLSGSASLDQILGPEEELVTGAEDPSEDVTPAGHGEEPAAAPEAKAKPKDANEVLAQLAAEYGLDLSNPAQRKALEDLAKLRGAGNQADAGQQGEPAEDWTVESLFAEAKPAEATKPAEGEGEKPADGPQGFGDLGDSWKDWNDAMQAEQEAWTEGPDGTVDMKKVADVRAAQFVRLLSGIGQQFIDKMIDRYMQENLGEVVQFSTQNRQQKQQESAKREVVDKFKAVKGYEGIEDLYKAVDDSKLKVGDKEYPNTPINQVLAKYPELLDIRVQHQDPTMAFKLSYAKQLKAVARRWKEMQESVPVKDAAQLVRAGQTIGQQKTSERTRQAFNAGGSATGAGSGPAGDDDWLSQTMKRAAGRGMSLKDL